MPATKNTRATHKRVPAVCRECGVERDHYTRMRDGKRVVMTPCVVCFNKRQLAYERRNRKPGSRRTQFPPLRTAPKPTDPAVVTEF